MEDNRLKEAIEYLDLEGWLEQYVELKDGGGYERRIETCPKCGNSSYKLYVNVDHKHWVCYVCRWGEGLHDVVVLMAEVSGRTLFDIRKELLRTVRPAPSGDLTAKLSDVFNKQPDKIKIASLVEVQLPGSNDFNGVIPGRVLRYVRDRGMSDNEIIFYRLRNATKLRGMSGPFVVFPVVYQDTAVSWQGRTIVKTESERKYVANDDVKDWCWPIDEPFVKKFMVVRYVWLVEGVFDAVGLWSIGEPALCTFGKSISERQIKLLKQLGIQDVRIMWDEDASVTSDRKLVRGAKGLRGEVEAAALKLQRSFAVSVVDLADPPAFMNVKKPDPGELLCHAPEIAPWMLERMEKRMSVSSPEFFRWRLGGN